MKVFLTLTLLLVTSFLFSQDVIFAKSGKEIKSKVLKITKTTIEYKKFSNPDGPTYTIEKNEVFFIKYKNGDKDIFDNDDNQVQSPISSNQENTNSYKQNKEFVYDSSIGEVGCQDNNYRKGNNGYLIAARFYGSEAQKIYSANDLVYFGLDISYSKLVDSKSMGKGEKILNKYAEKYNTYSKALIDAEQLQRWMKKRSVVKGTDVFQNYKKMDFDKFVVDSNYCLSISDIKKIVKGYVLKEKQGVGMVVIVATLDENRSSKKKLQEFTTVFITFFDISTREVLFAVEATGMSSAPTAFWHKRYAIGVSLALRTLFIDRIYKEGIVDINQLPEKYRLD